jgi:general secretion pathway protein K
MLANLFEVLGAQQQAAAEVAERIVGWRTPPKSGAANDEEALYFASGLTYSPRQAPFAHVNELSLVLGGSPALVERALPYVTVFSRSADVDVLIAAPEVIAALPGMTPEALNDFLKQRSSLPRDKAAIAAALGPAKAAGILPQTKSFRVLTTLRFDNGRRMSSEAVIALTAEKGKEQDKNKDTGRSSNNSDKVNTKDKDKDKGPYTILSWQDDVETGTRSVRRAGG